MYLVVGLSRKSAADDNEDSVWHALVRRIARHTVLAGALALVDTNIVCKKKVVNKFLSTSNQVLTNRELVRERHRVEINGLERIGHSQVHQDVLADRVSTTIAL